MKENEKLITITSTPGDCITMIVQGCLICGEPAKYGGTAEEFPSVSICDKCKEAILWARKTKDLEGLNDHNGTD